MIRRSVPGVLMALALAACGGEGEIHQVAADSSTAAAPSAAPHSDEAAEPEPLDSAAVARAIAEDSALEAENRREYERRVRSMGSYEDCVRQAASLPPEARARVVENCKSRRGAP